MRTKARKWWYGLGSALITGFSSSLLTCMGINGAQAVGVQVAQLDVKQLATVTIFGGLVGMAAYLKQSPLPPPDDDSTMTI